MDDVPAGRPTGGFGTNRQIVESLWARIVHCVYMYIHVAWAHLEHTNRASVFVFAYMCTPAAAVYKYMYACALILTYRRCWYLDIYSNVSLCLCLLYAVVLWCVHVYMSLCVAPPPPPTAPPMPPPPPTTSTATPTPVSLVL